MRAFVTWNDLETDIEEPLNAVAERIIENFILMSGKPKEKWRNSGN